MFKAAIHREAPWREFAQAPLVPWALGAAIGIVADRLCRLPLEASLGLAAVGACTALAARSWARLLLAVAIAGLTAAYHHTFRHVYPADDLGWLAQREPAIVRLRGTLDEQPVLRTPNSSELLGPARRGHRASSVLLAREVQAGSGPWMPVSGRVRLVVELDLARGATGPLDGLLIGDEVECVGLLATPAPPANPGEVDYRERLLDQRIRCELRVTKDTQAVIRLHDEAAWSVRRVLAKLRGRLTAVLWQTMPEPELPLARALLLGDGSATRQEEWDAFARTGVLHVLVISGQHMAVLAAWVWLMLRWAGMPRRPSAAVVLALVLLYAALAGGRPPAVRAAVMVAVLSLGILLRQPVHAANAFALAWLLVVAVHPAEAASTGTMLSFLSVFVLIWGAGRWLKPAVDFADSSASADDRPGLTAPGVTASGMAAPGVTASGMAAAAGITGRWIANFFAINAILLTVNAPLIASVQHVVPMVGLLLGPPVIVSAMLAMIFGFGLLLVGMASTLMAAPLAWLSSQCLAVARQLVTLADAVPGGTIYVADLPMAWLVGFYALLIAFVLLDGIRRRRMGAVLLLWTILGLAAGGRQIPDELRVTFLAVGHGGCTVLEAPDGRVIVYDAGCMAGPEAVRRSIAPYLWHRRIRFIDELILSHADLDHFNGVPELLRRFGVGCCTLTPSFAEKPTAEVAATLAALARYRVPRRVVAAGDEFTAGEVRLRVLHPPASGPAGSENERSLVLLISHLGHTLLLTGDLERAGTAMLLSQSPVRVDVLMAPHHGSAAALPEALRCWAEPGLIVASRGPRFGGLPPDLNAWDTFHQGAITLRSHRGGLTAESYLTQERRVVRFGSHGR